MFAFSDLAGTLGTIGNDLTVNSRVCIGYVIILKGDCNIQCKISLPIKALKQNTNSMKLVVHEQNTFKYVNKEIVANRLTQ